MKKEMKFIWMCFVLFFVMYIPTNVYAQDVSLTVIPDIRYEDANQQGVTVGEVLIQVTGATFKEDLSYDNYDKAFTVVDAPVGYEIVKFFGGVQRVSPQMLKIKIQGNFPLFTDEFVRLKFKDTAFNENERGLTLLDNGIVELQLIRGPKISLSTSVIDEKELINGFRINGMFSNFPVIKTDRGTFKEDISVNDMVVTPIPDGYDPFVKWKSSQEIYFTLVPNNPYSPRKLTSNQSYTISLEPSAYWENVKIKPNDVTLTVQLENTVLPEDRLNIITNLQKEQESLLWYDLVDEQGYIVDSKLKPLKGETNLFYIEKNVLSNQVYSLFLRRKVSDREQKMITADITAIINGWSQGMESVHLAQIVMEDRKNIETEVVTKVLQIDNRQGNYQINFNEQNDIPYGTYEEKEIANGSTYSSNKVFTITFNSPLSREMFLKHYIYVTKDLEGKEKVPGICIEWDPDNMRQVKVHPSVDGWETSSYYLYIDKGIEAENGKTLEKGVRSVFHIQ